MKKFILNNIENIAIRIFAIVLSAVLITMITALVILLVQKYSNY